MEFVSSGFDRCVQNRSSRTAEFRTEIGRLHLEFLNCIDWRKNNKVGTVEKINCVGIVVDTVEQVVVLGRAKAVSRESAARGVTARISLRRIHTSGQLRQTIQRMNRLIANQQRDIEKTMDNLRAVSENMKEITDNSKKYPSQVLFGAPPPPSKAMQR